MSRFINPTPQYKPSSKLYFFKSGTNSPLTTYSDQLETTPNTHPVLTDSAGFVPNIFFSGSARLVVLDSDDVQYIDRDHIGSSSILGNFSLWDAAVTYDKDDIVKTSSSKFYQSFANGNQGNDPATSATDWFEIRFVGVYNANKTYSIGDVVQTSNGSLWKSVVGSNIGNTPTTDSGTNWLPAVDGSKIPEIILLTWAKKTADFTAEAGGAYIIDASANTIDATLPTIAIGDVFTFHSANASSFKVQILNPSYSIISNGGTISAGTDMELQAGNSVQLVALTTSILQVVGVKL